MRAWRRGGIALVLACVAGCGGYAGDEAPAPYPGDESSTGTASTAPTSPDGAAALPGDAEPTARSTGSPGATASPARGTPVSCSLRRGGPNQLVIRVAPDVRDAVASFRVQLLQGQISRQVIFPVEEPESAAKLGVSYRADAYAVRLIGDGLPMNAAWVAKAPVTLTVEGRTPSESVRYWRTQTVRFRLAYPNGERCPPEVFSFATALRPKDRAGVF